MNRKLGVLGLLWSMTAWAQNPVITSFPGTGTLTWENPSNFVFNYRVEWASRAEGPWSDFTCTAPLDYIIPTGAVMSASVPMFYRIVADYTPPGMVRIPGGTNEGTNPLAAGESYIPDYYPATYSLSVDFFCMDQCEVTKALWDEVYAWAITNGYTFDNAGSGKATNHPVHSVNWYDCVKWCNARSEKEGRPAVYTVGGVVYRTGQNDDVEQAAAAGYRLPTREEWEYAARGGAVSRRFPWSDSDEIQHARANYESTTMFSFLSYDTSPTRGFHPTYNDGIIPYTSPAGAFAANEYGLYDMAGNVREWCFDRFPDEEGTNRVFRSGAWSGYAYQCRIGMCSGRNPGETHHSQGFRTVFCPGSEADP